MRVTFEHITPGLEGVKSTAENPRAETWSEIYELVEQAAMGIGFSPRTIRPEYADEIRFLQEDNKSLRETLKVQEYWAAEAMAKIVKLEANQKKGKRATN